MRSRVLAGSRGLPRSASDTVFAEKPVAAAMSFSVARGRFTDFLSLVIGSEVGRAYQSATRSRPVN